MRELILDGSKILYHNERLNEYLSGENIAPITIECAITTKCNYKCVFCSKKFEKIEEQVTLDKKTVFDFLEDAAEIGVKGISFIGDGENTCSPYLIDAIKYGKKLGLDMALGTNGFLLKYEDLEEILPLLTYIRFSICAADRERYAEIHGCSEKAFEIVKKNIKYSVEYKKDNNLDVTIGMQMVLMPEFGDQILPLTVLGRDLGVDYLVIKHCSDDVDGSIGVNYDAYKDLYDLLHKAEGYSTSNYQVTVKWSKINDGKNRIYTKCYAAPFLIQMSGSGLIAPCGPLFHPKFAKYHFGNIRYERFKSIWSSEKYKDICRSLAEGSINPQTECPYLCLQHNANNIIWNIKENGIEYDVSKDDLPKHINFA